MFQPYCVDNAIGEGAEKDENGGKGPTRRRGERQRGDEQGEEADEPPRARAERPAREWTRARAPHQLVEIALVIMIEGACGPRRAEHRHGQAHRLPPREHRPVRRCHPGERTRRNRNSDPELQERDGHAHSSEHQRVSVFTFNSRISGTARVRTNISS
jgi:hypothetical protein